VKEFVSVNVQVSESTGLRTTCRWVLEEQVFLAVSTSAFFLAAIWAYFPTIARALGNFCLEGVFEGWPDILSDPEALLPLVVFVLLVWALAAILRFAAVFIIDIFSGDFGAGPRGLGLK